jgi:hypothetical protein
MVTGLVEAVPGPRLLAQSGLAGGNPLYVRELVDALVRDRAIRVEHGVAELADPVSSDAPRSLPSAISAQLGFLSQPSVQLLRVAALFGAEFTLDDITIVTGKHATEVAAVIDEAIAAGVVADDDGRLLFRHALIRQALYGQTPASLRSALHRQAAESLARTGAPVERVAGQLLAAPQAVDGWVVAWLIDVASSLTHRAPQVAVDLLTRVRGSVGVADPRRERIDASLAAAFFMLGRDHEVEEVARPVLANTSNPDVAGQTTWTLAYALDRMSRHDAALEVLDTAIRDTPLTEIWGRCPWST